MLAVRPGAPPPGEELVKIQDMQEWQQLAFAGYKYAFCSVMKSGWSWVAASKQSVLLPLVMSSA